MGEDELRLVAVASAANSGEAQMIHGLLKSEGIRSVIGRTRGPKQVLVAAAQAEEARALIARVVSENEADPDLLRRRWSG